MRNFSSRIPCFLAVFVAATARLTAPVGAATANVTVDFTAVQRTLDPYAFSGSISTFGVDGGSITVSPAQRDRLGSLRLGLYRVPLQWNGGTVISSARGGPADVSGDDWVGNIRAFGGTPMIVVGGAGRDNAFSPDDAASLVRHFNLAGAEPVRYWVIGNEPGNEGMSMDTYCRLFTSTADAMKAVDPTIKVAGPAWSHYDRTKLERFLRCAGTRLDVIDYHHYAMGSSYLSNGTALSRTGQWETEVNEIRQSIQTLVPARAGQIEIQVGEYNWSWRTENRYPGWNGDDRFYQSVVTVWSASVAGHIARAGGRGHQYADQNGALGLTFERVSEASHFGRAVNDPMPIYHGLRMFSGGDPCGCGQYLRPFGTKLVPATTSLSNLEVYASTDGNNAVLVNKSSSSTKNVLLRATGAGSAAPQVWQTDRNAPFDPPRNRGRAVPSADLWSVTLPPYSVTTLVW